MLLLVTAAAVMIVRREMSEPTHDTSGSAAQPLPSNAVVVYYFHGDTRCPTCRNIEAFSHHAVQSAFANELTSGQIEWRVVNYETAANRRFADDYNLVAPSVVVVRAIDGKVVAWRNLDRVWELVGDQESFAEYVQRETKAMLKS
jgi:hypothetical protein